ncbi:MAG TPA: helix-turn-helix transcriptional regulator [Thermoanaerobacterales bacterium]|nr:helix-turn-helix transcriptional regulator [Thermoanaerobacterales bacterium]
MPTDEIFRDIGKKIRQIRQKQNLTQEELGEKANLHYSYIGQMERGDKIPSLKTLNKIAKALNVSLDYILEGPIKYSVDSAAENSINEFVHILRTRPARQTEMLISICRNIIEELDAFEKENDEK